MNLVRVFFAALVLGPVLTVSSFADTTSANPSAALWIWGTPDARQSAPSGRCDFRRRFQLSKVKQALLRMSCDEQYVLRLNGRVIGLGSNWQQMDSYDVTPLLRDGENEILVRCRNMTSAAGLVLKLEAELEDGSDWRLVSDRNWEARLQQAGTWDPDIVNRTPWTAAHELVAYGKAGTPWGILAPPKENRAIRFSSRTPADRFELVDGDRVLFLGNTFIERSQKYGYLEAALTSAFPDADVVYRNLGWSGDTVFGHARARFGTVADGFQHLETHVFGERPTLVFINYGTNESFKGEAGIAEFIQGLSELVDVVSATGAHVVLMTPIPHENLGPPLPDASSHNGMLKRYRDAIVAVARQQQCTIVDMFERLPKVKQLHGVDFVTENGMHLGELGYWHAAQALLAELGVQSEIPEVVVDVATNQSRSSNADVDGVSFEPDRITMNYRPHRIRIGLSAENSTELRRGEPSLVLKFNGLGEGRYQLIVDGQKVAQGKAAEWARGLSMPLGDQTAELLQQICKKNEFYFHRWRPQNETYLFLFRKHEQGNNAVEIPQFDPLVRKAEASIATLRVPKQRSIELVRVP